MKTFLVLLAAFCLFAAPAYPQSANKLRVLSAPGVKEAAPKNWHNSLGISGDELDLHCPKCSPIHDIEIPRAEIGTLRYGQNAYHHWVAGIVTGIFSLGTGLIVGLMPHHQHFFSIDMNDGKVIGIQADKSDYRKIAGMLENFTGLPILVTAKDAHFLDGFRTQITTPKKKKKEEEEVDCHGQ
jgi:hypothetical protein